MIEYNICLRIHLEVYCIGCICVLTPKLRAFVVSPITPYAADCVGICHIIGCVNSQLGYDEAYIIINAPVDVLLLVKLTLPTSVSTF